MGGAQPSGASAGDLVEDGKRHLAPVTFDTKGDAGAWLDMMHAELLEHRWKPSPPPVPKPLTFKEYGRTWLAERELKPRTRSEYTRMLAILEDYFADAQLRAVTSADVKAWYATLDASKKTARAHLFSLLRTIFATAAADELVDANPQSATLGPGRPTCSSGSAPPPPRPATGSATSSPPAW